MEKKHRCIQQKWLINCSTNIPNSNKTFRALEFPIFKMNKQSKRHTCYTGLSYLKFGIGFYLNAFKKATEMFHSDKKSHTIFSVCSLFTVQCITTNKIEKNYFLMRFDLLLCDFVSKILIIFIENIIDLLLLKWKTGIIDSNVFPSPRSPHIDFNFYLSDCSALGWNFAWLRFGSVSFHYIYCHINSYLRENSNNTIWYSTSYCHI